jgi:hypothetical protein
VTGLSWDAFPAPTPEAEEWKPDPDSVPVAGGLPDPRFNKDPLTQQQKKAFKRDKLLGLYLDGPSESTTVTSTASSVSRTSIATGVGSWPAAAPRAKGYPRALAPSVPHPLFSSPPSPPPESVAQAEAVTKDPAKTLATKLEVAMSSQHAHGCKGTTETLPVQQLFQRPHSPPMSTDSQASESSSKTPIPAWARKFEHLLNESSPKELALQSAPLGRSPLPQPIQAAPVKFVSTPPHLRKQQSSSTSATPVAIPNPRFDGVEVISAPQDKVQPTASLAALPSSSTSPLRDPSVATRLGPINLVEVSTLDFVVCRCSQIEGVSGSEASARELHPQEAQLIV